jgi:hypothetical protein
MVRDREHTFEASEQFAEEEFYPVSTYREPDQVGCHHHQNIEDSSQGSNVAIPPFASVLSTDK